MNRWIRERTGLVQRRRETLARLEELQRAGVLEFSLLDIDLAGPDPRVGVWRQEGMPIDAANLTELARRYYEFFLQEPGCERYAEAYALARKTTEMAGGRGS